MIRWITVVLVILLLWLQWQLWGELAKVNALNDRLTEQLETNTELKDLNDALFAEVQDLREGLEAIEERARSELGLIGEGESFYLIVDPNQLNEGPSEAIRQSPSTQLEATPETKSASSSEQAPSVTPKPNEP